MLETLLKTTGKIDAFLDSAMVDPEIVLYGAGFALADILKTVERHGFSVMAICDSDPAKHGSKFRDRYPVMALGDAAARFPGARFLISSPTYFDDIEKLLREKLAAGRVCNVDLTCAYFFDKGEFRNFLASELGQFEEVSALLHDDRSRETYARVIQAHLSGDRADFERASTGTEDLYLFHSLLKPSADTVYVDCGAYDGDTVNLFIEAADGGYARIYAFEPDPTMQENLQAVAEAQDGRVEIIATGVADRDGTINFAVDGVFSAIVADDLVGAEGVISIPVTKLDSFLVDEPVSIIKMDIEGGEYDALKGAAQLIRKYRPKLAVCLYHRVDDFIRIAKLIRDIVPEYKLRLEHQSNSCTDTVLFATLE
ncbi:FkbM family methyltransferase [Sphingobium sufflavum]|uniref:FkbM family methyltransferase n=1 Tax=Sphingobium sufflavum TaxID=1129547 RepID=UPI001EFF995A|nr:FkbM family methyltransferase [Sphingobium sufflavum]MCE7796644.1 FkbM family methyltransferase [Sphingobium sufflavum]